MAVLTVAVIALGGGYSLAANLKGSGTLQKENEIGVPTGSTPEVIRTIKGIGDIRSTFCNDVATGIYEVGLRNTSGEALQLYIDRASDDGGPAEDPDVEVVGNGATATILQNSTFGESESRIHVFPVDGSKRPQARIMLGSRRSPDNCAGVQVSVLNLTTEE